MDAAAIETIGLTHAFGTVTVLDGVDIRVRPGEVVALLGPNGAGKTTLVRILSTLIVADSGTARVNGFDVTTDADDVRASISLTGQYAAVDEKLTGRENLVMIARLLGFGRAEASERAVALLDQFDLTDAASRLIKTWSGGMRRRLDLAVSLIAHPPVVFLDEPTTGLDTRSRQGLWEQIRELARGGTTVLLTTQYLEEADQLADRILVLDAGRIVADGTPTAMKSRIGGEVIEVRDLDENLLRSESTDGSISALRRAIDAIDGDDLGNVKVSIRTPTLDDVFLSLTGHGASESPNDNPNQESRAA